MHSYFQFTDYLTAAQKEALTEREIRLVNLRYGFTDGKRHTLADVGMQEGLSLERIRQILEKAFRKMRAKAAKQIESRRANKPCARLKIYLETAVKTQDPGTDNRAVHYAKDFLSPVQKTIGYYG